MLGECFEKYGPYYDQTGGAMAFKYACRDCDFNLVTVAEFNLLPENRAILVDHQLTAHGRKIGVS